MEVEGTFNSWQHTLMWVPRAPAVRHVMPQCGHVRFTQLGSCQNGTQFNGIMPGLSNHRPCSLCVYPPPWLLSSFAPPNTATLAAIRRINASIPIIHGRFVVSSLSSFSSLSLFLSLSLSALFLCRKGRTPRRQVPISLSPHTHTHTHTRTQHTLRVQWAPAGIAAGG